MSMPEDGNPAAGVVAALFAALFAGGAIGVARGVSKAGSTVVRVAAPSMKVMAPLAVADDIAVRPAFDALATARLLRQSADDIVEFSPSAIVSDDVERAIILKHRKASASDELLEESQVGSGFSDALKSLLEEGADTGIQELLKQLSGSTESDPTNMKDLDQERLDDFIFSDSFLGRYKFYLDAGQVAEAANTQRAVIYVAAQFARYDENYRPALAFALACQTWTAVLDGAHEEAIEAGRLLALMPTSDRANLDMRPTLLNVAHAQMLVGNEVEAIDTYLSFANGDYGTDYDWRAIIEQDFASLRGAGQESDDMDFVLVLIGPSVD